MTRTNGISLLEFGVFTEENIAQMWTVMQDTEEKQK